MRICTVCTKAALAVMMAAIALGVVTACGDGTKLSSVPDVDPLANPADPRGVTSLIHRSSGNYEARWVEITPGSSGGSFGKALHLSTGGKLIYARFMPFATAIERGNTYVTTGDLPRDVVSSIPDAETERTDPDPSGAGELQQQFTQGNILTLVVPNSLTGYHVNVFVDNAFIVQIFKDCNFCNMFTQQEAVARAQSYLSMLQGWAR